MDEPDLTHRHCVDATFTLLMAGRDAHVKRFVYAASSSAYGDTPTLPKVETMRPEPLSPYAVGKLVGEYYLSVFAKVYGLETISLRYFNVFGPGQDPASQYAAAIPAFVTAILKNRPPTVYGDGEQSRDFTYIDNVVHANLLAARARNQRGGDQCRLRRSGHGQRDLRPDQPPPGQERQTDLRAGPCRRCEAFPGRHHCRQDVDCFKPVVPFQEGLERSIDWYRRNLG